MFGNINLTPEQEKKEECIKKYLVCPYSSFMKDMYFICRRTGVIKGKLVEESYGYMEIEISEGDNILWCPDDNEDRKENMIISRKFHVLNHDLEEVCPYCGEKLTYGGFGASYGEDINCYHCENCHHLFDVPWIQDWTRTKLGEPGDNSEAYKDRF